MKTRQIFLLLALPILILAACSPKPAVSLDPTIPPLTATSSVEVAEPSVAYPIGTDSSSTVDGSAKPDAASPTTLTDAEMEALIFEKARTQHTLDFILSQNKTAVEWSKTLDRMIAYGAKISPEEKELIINWLVGRNN